MSTETWKTWHEFEIQAEFTHVPAEPQTSLHPAADAYLTDFKLFLVLEDRRIQILEYYKDYAEHVEHITAEYMYEVEANAELEAMGEEP